jgi:Periplasmic binding protein-like domain
MQHLAALGYRRIAYAGGPVASWSDRERAETFRNVRAELPELDLIELGNFPPFFSGGIQAGDLAIASGATAIVAFSDLMAVGLIDRLRQRRLSVLDDIRVTGFDNVRVSRLVWTNLTTVGFPPSGGAGQASTVYWTAYLAGARALARSSRFRSNSLFVNRLASPTSSGHPSQQHQKHPFSPTPGRPRCAADATQRLGTSV